MRWVSVNFLLHDPNSNPLSWQNGFLEERSPLLAIRLPLPFRKDHPHLTRNLRLNANRLTTPHDLYATLRHIINLSTGSKLETKAEGCQMCKSLFYEIPFERTCIDVNIPHHSCPCTLIKLDGSDEVVQYAARHSVEILNKDVRKIERKTGGNCSQLRLLNVTSAYHQTTSPWHIQYIIQFEVTPSKARFEALLERKMKTLVYESPQFELMQAIVHLNEADPICVPPTDDKAQWFRCQAMNLEWNSPAELKANRWTFNYFIFPINIWV